ncbi:spermine oxidase-like isoform X2 [Babylonia areolata]|uniref:spermine oxidase-like isoform X2 n=1 Tax=Babylonia areolata TaxID=304850 RepID=UPI003FCF8513
MKRKRMEKDRGSVRVVVVGAGVSGLSTAHHLLEAGFSNVTLLEGSNRVGGRVRSVEVSEGVVVELGATCIHGASADNPIFSLATQWGLASSLVPLNRIGGQYYRENGEIIDKALVEQVWNLYLDMETDMATMAESDDRTEALQDRTTVAQFVEKARPQILQHFPEGEEREAADKAFNSMLNYLQFMSGDCLDKTSADLFGQYKTIPGPEMMFTGKGYSGFIEKLREKIPDEVIQLNTEVTKICWGGDQVEILCKENKTYSADHVVVTCSLGHLKANYQSMFEPPLPASKAGAIQRRGFGPVTKLFLYFDQPTRQEGIKLAWSSHGDPITESSQWVKSFTWLDMQPTNTKTIGGPFAGEGAVMMESLPEEDVAAQCTKLLRQFLRDPSFPEPSKVLRSDWNSSPLYKGGYSYPSNESQVDDVQHLAAPVPNRDQPRILFAGEATHPDYYSTVHGAYLSGVRESKRLTEHYKQ